MVEIELELTEWQSITLTAESLTPILIYANMSAAFNRIFVASQSYLLVHFRCILRISHRVWLIVALYRNCYFWLLICQPTF